LGVVGGDLFLHGTKVTDLSSIRRVGGRVYIDDESRIINKGNLSNKIKSISAEDDIIKGKISSMLGSRETVL
jgi:hypothetical protein